MKTTENSEIRLIHELRESGISAFNELFTAYHRKILNFAFTVLNSKEEAEEVVQNTFIAIWENRASIDPDRSFSTYIYTIARHHIYNALKKRIYKKAFLEKINDPFFEWDVSTENNITFNELQSLFDQIIEKLPPKRKQIFRLNRDEGLTYKQIAEKTGLSENTVDTQIRKSLEYIRATFNKLSR